MTHVYGQTLSGADNRSLPTPLPRIGKTEVFTSDLVQQFFNMNRVQTIGLIFAASTLFVSGAVQTDGVVNLTKKTYSEAVSFALAFEHSQEYDCTYCSFTMVFLVAGSRREVVVR
jgi:hypothetical protein